MVRGEVYRSRRNESKTEHQWCIQDDKKNNWEKRNATDGIKDKDGKILIDGEQVLNRWKTHTENMYSQPEDQLDRRRLLYRRTEDEPTPLVEEVREAMKKLKNQKLPGCDGIPTELWKAAGENGIRLMHRICNTSCAARWPPQYAPAP